MTLARSRIQNPRSPPGPITGRLITKGLLHSRCRPWQRGQRWASDSVIYKTVISEYRGGGGDVSPFFEAETSTGSFPIAISGGAIGAANNVNRRQIVIFKSHFLLLVVLPREASAEGAHIGSSERRIIVVRRADLLRFLEVKHRLLEKRYQDLRRPAGVHLRLGSPLTEKAHVIVALVEVLKILNKVSTSL